MDKILYDIYDLDVDDTFVYQHKAFGTVECRVLQIDFEKVYHRCYPQNGYYNCNTLIKKDDLLEKEFILVKKSKKTKLKRKIKKIIKFIIE